LRYELDGEIREREEAVCFIAERIGASLAEGETGLLFMGALHQVARLLPTRIRVEYLAVRAR